MKENPWYDWKKEKPKEKGYYIFAIRSGGNSYGCNTDIFWEYYDPLFLDYGVFKREYFEDKDHFSEILLWMERPKFPWEN